MTLDKVLYTAQTTTTGGRQNGRSRSSDGALEVSLSTPREMGGAGGTGTNPEQLFAAGYSACFLGAMKAVGAKMKTRLPEDTSIDASVFFGPLSGGAVGYGIAVEMAIRIPGVELDQAQAIVDAAHKVCPYSNAVRGNVEVRLKVV